MPSRLLALVFVAIGIACADPVAVTWSGIPTVTAQCCVGTDSGYLEPPGLNAVQNGLDADLSTGSTLASWNPFPSDNATIEIPFTISAPAEIAVNVAVNYNGGGTDCGDVSCPELANWTLYGGFSGGIEITDDKGNEVLFVPFGVNGSVAATCDDLQCSGGLALSDAESGMADLAAGTYLLTDSYQMHTESVGDSWTSLDTQVALSDPIETPEPRFTVWWLGVAMAGMLMKKWKSHQRTTLA